MEKGAMDKEERPNYAITYTGGITSVKFSPNGQWLASACEYLPVTVGVL